MQIALIVREHSAYGPAMQGAYARLVENVLSQRHEKRRQRLLDLVGDDQGAITSLALAVGTPRTHLSAILNGRRGLGDALAARIEDCSHKPRGWLDGVSQASLSEDALDLAAELDAIKDPTRRKEALKMCRIYFDLVKNQRNNTSVDEGQVAAQRLSPSV